MITIKVTHVPDVSETRWRVSHEICWTLHDCWPTRPIEPSHFALMPPGQSSGRQQCANVGMAVELLVVSHQPGRDATRLPPGQDAPSEQT